jgi:hypothetical protein
MEAVNALRVPAKLVDDKHYDRSNRKITELGVSICRCWKITPQ